MEPRDDDIEFDFFDDEPATGETQSTSRSGSTRAPRRGLRGPAGPPRGLTPMLRLLGLVVGAIILVLLFGLLIKSCTGSSKKDAYASYMSSVTDIARLSTANGKKVATVLTTPGLKVTEIDTKLKGIAAAERQNVQAAQKLDPPGKLRDQNAHLIESLQFRVNGVASLAATFRRTAASKNNSNDAALLSEQAARLIASDVIWADLFKALSVSQMTKDGITGVRVPDSQFVAGDLATARSMSLVLQRIRGASTGGTVTNGLHGTNIVSVKALPGGQTLSPDSLNTVTATTDLVFAVTVEDSGDFQEVQIPVTLTIQKTGAPIVQTQKIQLINPGEKVVVNFGNLGSVPFARQTTLRIDVKPVAGEIRKDNNTAEFPVIFSLPG